ncbi:E3 ubiquitin-protein ligase SPL2-like [Telopea speciosissima]|uniref:E3 ubiquitin-protein ligase SPL2-like n=1 Tax=Telopea speciosissima TaxID=54955 RepID=UPI001CC7ACE4|nr:E3 ubiquitin-protein ligase SPL2-like [Telopea speciosissima]XP_043707275.1 E3 ubiquitin-protein ligase SPL2-like [Telopea speciosissima]
MSSHDGAAAAVFAQVALSADGAVIGLVLAYVAIQSFFKFSYTSSALRKIRRAPAVRVSDLRFLLSSSDDSNNNASNTDESEPSEGKLLFVRGLVEAKSTIDGNWRSLRPNVLVSHESGERGVVLQRTQTCIYNEWRGLFGWTSDLRTLFARSWKEQKSTSLRTVPFILVEAGQWPHTDYVIVNLDGSRHPLPLMTVYHQLQPVHASPYTFLQALFGHEYPVGLLDEEKILPLGKEISAVGVCRLQDGTPEIKSCKDLPFFLSDMTKDQMVVDLAFRTKVLLWGGILLGSLSFGILGYAIVRNWNRWKEWRQQMQTRQPIDTAAAAIAEIGRDEDVGDVPDGELCVICLMQRRRSAFVPCGHFVCCQGCALSVERESAPKCPVCRQTIRTSIRIYNS